MSGEGFVRHCCIIRFFFSVYIFVYRGGFLNCLPFGYFVEYIHISSIYVCMYVYIYMVCIFYFFYMYLYQQLSREPIQLVRLWRREVEGVYTSIHMLIHECYGQIGVLVRLDSIIQMALGWLSSNPAHRKKSWKQNPRRKERDIIYRCFSCTMFAGKTPVYLRIPNEINHRPISYAARF